MADADQATLQKIRRLLEALTELREKECALIEEIGTLASGGIGISGKLKALERAWQAAWSSRYHTDYLFAWAKDRVQEKRLLARFSVDDLAARMQNYIQSDDAFYLRARHSFGLFVASINAHASLLPTPTVDEPPVGCAHRPPCVTDRVHTQRKLAAASPERHR